MIYEIRRNTWTGTYTVLRTGKPVMLTRTPTGSMKKFMRAAQVSRDGIHEVYRRKDNGKH